MFFGKKNTKTKKRGLLTGMLVGGAVGSVLSLLFASTRKKKSSRETVNPSNAEKFLKRYKK